MSDRSLAVPPESAGSRLDALLSRLSPLSLRGRRRLIAQGLVLLNGKRGAAGARLRRGDVVELLEAGRPSSDILDECRLVSVEGGLALLSKPAGLHSVRLAGGNGPSLEDAARELLGEGSTFSLLQRLDWGTSGLVAAALDEEGRLAFREAEAQGLVVKAYAALLEGELEAPVTVRSLLAPDGRGGSRALDREDENPLRWTHLVPLAAGGPRELVAGLEGEGRLSLAGCLIRRGARHQIRVLAAALGHALAGDRRYGASRGEGFLLHHALLLAPGLRVRLLPAWPLLPGPGAALEAWLDSLPPEDEEA